MKRSKFIDLQLMRKQPVAKSITLGVGAALLSGCDSQEPVDVISSIGECLSDTQMAEQECRFAYQQALEEAELTGPKYVTEGQCESEFGMGRCESNALGQFTPIMVGYLFSQSLWNQYKTGSQFNPVYRYFRPFSPLHNKLITADGEEIGDWDDDDFKVKKKLLKKKKRKSRAVSRGGFGKVAAKKSRSSSRSWGG